MLALLWVTRMVQDSVLGLVGKWLVGWLVPVSPQVGLVLRWCWEIGFLRDRLTAALLGFRKVQWLERWLGE